MAKKGWVLTQSSMLNGDRSPKGEQPHIGEQMRKGEQSPNCPSKRVSLTLEKGIRILDCFDIEHQEWSLRELADQAEVARPTAYRLVKTLVDLKYLARNSAKGTYHLGPGLVKAAYVISSHSELVRVAHRYLEELATETTESACLAVYRDFEVLVIDAVLTSHPFKPVLPVGLIMPGFGTAHGKLFLAFGPEHKRQEVLSRPLEQRTDYTVTNPGVLDGVLDRVKKDGIAFCIQEWQMGMCAVAAPIFGSNGSIVASLAVLAPSDRWGPTQKRSHSAAVRRAAAKISRKLGYQQLVTPSPAAKGS